MFRLFNKRTISIVNTVFNLTCSCRPLTDTPYNLKTDMDIMETLLRNIGKKSSVMTSSHIDIQS